MKKISPVRQVNSDLYSYWTGAFTNEDLELIINYFNKTESEMQDSVLQLGIKSDYRKSKQRWVDHDENDHLSDMLSKVCSELNSKYYRFDIDAFYEQFQYTVYNSSDKGHYNWHVDSDITPYPRKLTLVLQLSDPSDYEGGELLLTNSDHEIVAPKEKGLIVCFPSYTLHKVTPVTSGTRKTLVAWASGPAFR